MVLVVLALLVFGIGPLRRALNTVSTDDAYVNGHVTFVAARVPGQVTKVLVDDNNRVRQGDLLVQLDREPYTIQVALKQAVVDTAKTNVLLAQDQVRATVAQARSNRFRLEHAIEDVNNQLAALRAKVAQHEVEKANLVFAESDFARIKSLVGKGAVSTQDFDKAKASLDVAKNRVIAAEQDIQQIRVSLGLPINSENPLDVPPDLDQTFSTVRQALNDLLASVAPLNVHPSSYTLTPREVVEEFYKRDPARNLDRIYAHLMENAPAIKEAEAKLEQAEADLDQAKLNLRYCDVFAEISGVVTRRNVNPGNNVQAGQGLMAIRSLTEIWIDANYKETQLADLRIGQRVEVDVDMYGRRHVFEGRITGFTMGTGSTLALLPPQNATGNFIKVVQRLPVRIELTNYDPDKEPLFVGLSVVPYVFIKEPPTGPHAGDVLQPNFFTTPPAEKPAESAKKTIGLTGKPSEPAEQPAKAAEKPAAAETPAAGEKSADSANKPEEPGEEKPAEKPAAPTETNP
ncbi:MAG TPA: HlyD family secretion protein [Pirellulales bacterium]|nr:HlyD family secretion protein [Pirellulales bacterium]